MIAARFRTGAGHTQADDTSIGAGPGHVSGSKAWKNGACSRRFPQSPKFPSPVSPATMLWESRPVLTATSGSPSQAANAIGRSTRPRTRSARSPFPQPVPIPRGSRPAPTATSGLRSTAWRQQHRDDQPDDPRHLPVSHPDSGSRALRDHGGPRRQPLVHRVADPQDRCDQPDYPRHHRVRSGDQCLRPERHHDWP